MPRDASATPDSSKKSRRASASGETRCYPRFPVALPVYCTERRRDTPRRWRGRTADVSGGGFAVELQERLRAGTRLTVELRTGIGPMHSEAEVLWARRVPGELARYRHGLRLAEGSELLDLPVGVLLGEWLRKMARAETKTARVPRRPSPRAVGRKRVR
jgi:hypothetical protein